MAKRPTFAQVKSHLFQSLASHGWRMSDPKLKVPHATSPEGVRLWFKSQAIYVGTGTALGDARSLVSDMRDVHNVEHLISSAKSYVGRSAGQSGGAGYRVDNMGQSGSFLYRSTRSNRAATLDTDGGKVRFGYWDGGSHWASGEITGHGKPSKRYGGNVKAAKKAILLWLAGDAGHSSGLKAVRMQKQAGGQILYTLGNRAATYSPHSGFTVFGFLDGGELRVAHGKPGKHYANAKTAETAIMRWLHEGQGRAGGKTGAARRARTAKARKQRHILIDRKGYRRSAYYRKDGTHVSAADVKPTRFREVDPGKPGRRARGSKKGPHRHEPKWIQRPGMLGGPGYTKRPWNERRELLESSLEQSGRKSTILRLQVLMRPVALKPETRKVLLHDLEWLEAHTLGWGR